MMNMAPLVWRENVGPLTVKRSAPPVQNAFGGFDASTPFDVVIDPIAVHPVSGRELDQMPEADRTTETIRLYTLERLFVADGGRMADRLEYDGRTYRVVRLENYQQQGGAYSALAALEEEAKS